MIAIRRSIRLPGGNQHWGALGLIAAVLLVYLGKAVVGGQMLSAVSSLYGLAPWNAVAPANLSHFYNALLIDQAKAHYPWDVLDRAAIHAGYFPTWNPLVLSGTPYFANSQSGLTSVFNIPLWILPLNYALGFTAWVKLTFGGYGAYLLVRRLGLGFWPGVLAGVSYALCAFNVTWLGHQTLVATAVCLPWLVLVIDRVAHRARLADLLALALVSALAMNGGHPGTETHVMGAAALYLLVRLATVQDGSVRERLRRGLLAVGAITLGVALMAFVLLPVLKASPGTAGRSLRAGGGPVLPASALKTALFPGWWGRPSEGNSGGPFNYVERTIYVGAVALLLAGLAVCVRGQWRRKLPFLAVALLGISVPFGVPVIHAIVVHLPAFDSVDDSRMAVVFEFAVAILAAFGLQAIIDRGASAIRWRAALVLALAALLTVIAFVALGPSLHDIRTTLNHLRTGRNYGASSILALTAIAWFALFLLAVSVVVALRMRGRLSGRTAAWLLVAVAVVDLYHFAHGFQPIGPPSQVVPPRTAAIAYLQRHAGGYRVFGTDGDLDVDYSMTYGLKDPSGYDPPQPTERYLQIWQLANPAQTAASEWIVSPQLTPTGMAAMNVLGVRYLLTSPVAPLPSGLSLRPVYKGTDALIYENPRAAAPALVPGGVRIVASARQDLATIAAANFQPRTEATIESATAGGAVQPAQGEATLQREADNEARVSATLTRGGLVVLDAAWDPGWTVQVDGHPSRSLQVDYVMRGVTVPAGRHTIVWRYHVRGLTAGIAISSIALVTMLAIGAVVLVRRRKQRDGTASPEIRLGGA